MTILALHDVMAGYGEAQILNGVSLTIGAGQCVAVLGRNGMGKTTLIRTILGQIGVTAGVIERFGDSTKGKPYAIARAGIGLVPEGRQIFGNLSVRENLTTFARPSQGEGKGWDLATVLDLFPQLADRLTHAGSALSGGEQQMLAIGRALMTNPRLLILDEATEGLAPLVCEQIWHCLGAIRHSGLAVLVVDKNIHDLAQIADYFFVLEKGVIVWHGSPQNLLNDSAAQNRYLGVASGESQ